MPIGIIINALSIVIGGILGALGGHKLRSEIQRGLLLLYSGYALWEWESAPSV